MNIFINFVGQCAGAVVVMHFTGCANIGSEPLLPPTEAAMRQELIGRWYKPQTYVRGEERPPTQPEIEYRADGTCTYYITGGQNSSNFQPSLSRESWPGHWRLKGTKLYRNWESNWHYFAGHGPTNGEIVELNSEEMKLRTEPFGWIEVYYRHPHWDEREPIELHPQWREPLY